MLVVAHDERFQLTHQRGLLDNIPQKKKSKLNFDFGQLEHSQEIK